MEDRMTELRAALDVEHGESVMIVARDLTDITGRLGAMRMMKLCIAIQMLGRRGLFGQAKEVVSELEQVYTSYKKGLACSLT